MAARVLLHIGLPKTATTYLQTILWSSRDRLRSEGVLLPGNERRDHLWASRVIRDDFGRRREVPRPERTSWERLRAELADWSGTGLVSHEFFAAASADQARRMVADLAPASVEVIITARDPLGLFTASWQESLKNRATTPMADYAATVSEDPAAIWNWRTLDLRLVLERWAQAVPFERIHVLPLDSTAPRDDIWRRFAGLLGTDPDSYDLSTSFANESMGVVEAELLRRVNERLTERKLLGRAFDKGVFLRTFLADERLVPRRGERFWPSPEQVAGCRDRGAAAVAYLSNHPVNVVGSADHLLVPADLPARRVADAVSDEEVAAVAVDLIAVLLEDVRALRSTEPVHPAGGEASERRWFSRRRR